jgi:hypothetical protein
MADSASGPPLQTLETGNAIFGYRPRAVVRDLRNSDDLAHAYLLLFPDDPTRHPNRLLTFACGYLPPVIPDFDLPEERGWAVVTAASPAPDAVAAAFWHDVPLPFGQPPPAAAPIPRVAGAARYSLAHRDDQTYLAYVLQRPATLGVAQQVLLLDQAASYRLRIKEPNVPVGLGLMAQPSYPPDLAERFDGHVSIPADPVDFLDYPWTQVLLIAADAATTAALTPWLKRPQENAAVQAAWRVLQAEATACEQQGDGHPFQPLTSGSLA